MSAARELDVTAHPPVCILTAGRGSRVAPLTDNLNKSLLPIGDWAALTHIIRGFPAGTEFVIGVGEKGNQVRSYLALAHPDLPVHFVEIDNTTGPGSGPGYSLLCCAPHLQRPFFCLPCDALISFEPTRLPEGNWAGLAAVPAEARPAYCNMRLEGGRVVELCDKKPCDDRFLAFTGLLFVRDFAAFWDGLRDAQSRPGEVQWAGGMDRLLAGPGLSGVEVEWTDIGDIEKYRAAVSKLVSYDFSKTDEAIYFVDKKVVRFFTDPKIADGRVRKARMRPELFPDLIGDSPQFYAYAFAPGRTLYESNSPRIFGALLDWLERDVWHRVTVPADHMAKLCHAFYHDKTRQRIATYRKKTAGLPAVSWLGDTKLEDVDALLDRVDWSTLAQGVPAFIHGDLQFDNVLFDPEAKRFRLIDWRQDFAGEVAYGDLYYDLAKLNGGLSINYDLVKGNYFAVEQDGDRLWIDFAVRQSGEEFRAMLMERVRRMGLDVKRVELLTALIYLNMSPMHHPPFDRALDALGRKRLQQALAI